MSYRASGVLPGRRLSFMDHILPLCQIMEIPLLVTEPWLYQAAQIYYPSMDLRLDEAPDFCLDRSLSDFDTLLTIAAGRLPNGHVKLNEYLHRGQARTIHTFHGNSDKYRNCYWIEELAQEDVLLFYGQFYADFAKEKGVLDRLKKVIFCGNYRQLYYWKHRAFFDRLASTHLFENQRRKTILYAPTWTSTNRRSQQRDHYSPLLETHAYVLDSIPDDFQVLVKLHPLLEVCHPGSGDELREKYDGHEQIRFIDNFPLIYPLLDKADYYLGDYSSIGYDFLSFDRPLFFINDRMRDPGTDLGVSLFECGVPISPDDFGSIYQIIGRTDAGAHRDMRQRTYDYAFGPRKELDVLKSEVEEALG